MGFLLRQCQYKLTAFEYNNMLPQTLDTLLSKVYSNVHHAAKAAGKSPKTAKTMAANARKKRPSGEMLKVV